MAVVRTDSQMGILTQAIFTVYIFEKLILYNWNLKIKKYPKLSESADEEDNKLKNPMKAQMPFLKISLKQKIFCSTILIIHIKE